MYIEEVILEGFKSYATRTVISGWDREFNAITGLNGTGKSNILDAICFVLGIDNLRQVRATSLQDLVYKRGQAGITKASVTIVFNNSNPAQSPVGYADCPQVTVTRQIVLNGKNKYLINGHNAQQKAVENLFQSVQLNVNNPHFLIMQGQITRVLNMKPEEILAMIEESAGTRMFEDRKVKAISTLEKKEKKVEEIAALLTDTIDPKLDALRAERSEFLEFKRTEADLERLQRLLAAFEYSKNARIIESEDDKLGGLREDLSSTKEQARTSQLALETVQDEILNVTKQRQLESKASAKIRGLEETCKEMAAKAARLQTQIEFKREALASEEKAVATLSGSLEEERKKVAKLEAQLSAVQNRFEAAEGKRSRLQADLHRDEDLLRSLETGLGGGDSAETGYAKLLREARDRLSQAGTALQQAQKKSASLQGELSSMEAQFQRAKKEGKATTDRISALQAKVDALSSSTQQPQSSGSSSRDEGASLARLHEERSRLEGAATMLRDELDALQSTVSSVEFRYNISDPSFDHGRVKGVVAQLTRLNADTLPYATALEVCAGGRLYNVVVSDEETATTLLDKGRLTRRVTIIPLSKIQSRPISAEKADLAAQVTNGQAMVGLSLVGFDADVAAAMEYVFGGTFVCANKEAAALMAFDRRFGQRAVTIQGDVYEPMGTLSGGSAPTTGGLLERLCRYRTAATELEGRQTELAEIREQIAVLEGARRGAAEGERLLRTKQQELALLQRQFALADVGQTLARHTQMTAELEALAKEISRQEELCQAAERECAQYAKEAAELSNDREGKLASLARQINAAKTSLAKDDAAYRKVADEHARLTNDLAAASSLIAELEAQKGVTKQSIQDFEVDIAQLQEEHLQAVTQHGGLRIKLDGEMRHLRKYDEELRALDERRRGLEMALEAATLEKTKITSSIAAAEKVLSKAQEMEQFLLSKQPWIGNVRSQFGVAGGPYDFGAHNMPEVAAKVKGLEAQRETLRKSINFSVMDMIDRVEAKEVELKQMVSTVKKDRTKIEGTITKLNDYMLEALKRTFATVNKDFGHIFSELLPGSHAKLDQLEGQPITAGLEIKVCLGGVWKQSLAELSGGQRSLVALSLILALLQFKPAPVYILDEVDAALDLSHTENIGRLLKARFKAAQFIVVSLKEGMFANANVLFRTRFRDGVSSIERIAAPSAGGPADSKGAKGRLMGNKGGKGKLAGTANADKLTVAATANADQLTVAAAANRDEVAA